MPVIPFPPPKKKGVRQTPFVTADSIGIVSQAQCAGCAIPFRPKAAWHRYCTKCFAGAMALRHLGHAKRLLAECR